MVLWRGYAKPSHLCGATLSVVMPAGYLHYNVVAKKLARRLQALGASACIEVGLGDDQHPQGYEAALDPWLALLWSTLRAKRPLPAGMTEVWCFGPHAIKAKTGSTCTIHICTIHICTIHTCTIHILYIYIYNSYALLCSAVAQKSHPYLSQARGPLRDHCVFTLIQSLALRRFVRPFMPCMT